MVQKEFLDVMFDRFGLERSVIKLEKGGTVFASSFSVSSVSRVSPCA